MKKFYALVGRIYWFFFILKMNSLHWTLGQNFVRQVFCPSVKVQCWDDVIIPTYNQSSEAVRYGFSFRLLASDLENKT